MIDHCEHLKDSDVKKCYCLQNKINKYERALQEIKKHQEMMMQSHPEYSSVWLIACKALED